MLKHKNNKTSPTQTTNKAYLRKTKDPEINIVEVLLFYKASHIGYMKPIR